MITVAWVLDLILLLGSVLCCFIGLAAPPLYLPIRPSDEDKRKLHLCFKLSALLGLNGILLGVLIDLLT